VLFVVVCLPSLGGDCHWQFQPDVIRRMQNCLLFESVGFQILFGFAGGLK
jgi:hypothetical protein